MSTSAVIRFEDSNIEVYKHWDGYPKDTLRWLTRFNTDFNKNRGVDVTYKIAQLLRDSVRSGEKFGLDAALYTGWGVSQYGKNYPYAYLYTLMSDGQVKVEEV